MYICPKGASQLRLCNKQFVCDNNHSFDISSKGYVNLLLGSKSGVHGDNKEMVTARREFLSKGLYSPIIDKVANIIKDKSHTKTPRILDAGCGEGYYTNGIKNRLESFGLEPIIYGLDVSKDAVGIASKAYKSISYSVASINALPFGNETFDFVISLFAPLCEDEFSRVLKSNGSLITVSPSENHLFGLKKAVYTTPYKNPPSTFVPSVLNKTDEISHEWNIELSSSEDITNLFKMTPYYYKTAPRDIEKALALNELSTTIGFVYGIYSK